MKNIFLLMLLTAAILFASCEKEPEYDPQVGFTDQITLTAPIMISVGYTETTVEASVTCSINPFPYYIFEYGFYRQGQNNDTKLRSSNLNITPGYGHLSGNSVFSYTITNLQSETRYDVWAYVKYGQTEVWSKKTLVITRTP